MRYTRIKGTVDIFGSEINYWYAVEDSAKRIARLYGYEEIRTPILEPTALFLRGVGEETDIVQKEMYSFKDRGDRDVTMRPEGTAPVVRAFLENSLVNRGFPQRFFYIEPMFRYEKPQSGRQRQFHQVGFELFGPSSPMADAEIVDIAVRFLREIGLVKFKVVLNSIGCEKCRPAYKKALREYYSRHYDELCDDCKRRFDRNILRLLDCKVDADLARVAPRSVDYLCDECREHYTRLKEILNVLGIDFEEDHRLVRGLDYYNRTVFEIRHELLGAQNAIAGGGRYDSLVRELGGMDVPALGFAAGIERIILAMKAEGIEPPEFMIPHVYMAHVGDVVKEAFEMSEDMRKRGITVYMDVMERGLRAQLKHANRIGAVFTLIVGENELEKGVVIVRDMESGEQTEVTPSFVADFILDGLRKKGIHIRET